MNVLQNIKLWLFAIASVLVVSCSSDSKNDVVPSTGSRAMKFSTELPEGWTKATRVGGLPSGYEGFCVSALLKDNNVWSEWIDDETAHWQGTAWMVDGATWPETGKMDFVAYAVSGNLEKATSLASGKYTAAVHPSEQNGDVVNSSFTRLNLNFGTNLDGHTDVIFTGVQSGYDCKAHFGATNDPVLLPFKHALAGITLTMRAEDEETAQRVKIKRAVINGVTLSGNLQVDYGTPDLLIWTAQGTPVDVDILSGKSPVDNLSADERTTIGNDALLVLPGTHAQSITLVYTIDGADAATSAIEYYYTYTFDAGLLWQAGYQHQFNFTCKLQLIGFDGFKLTDWGLGADEDINI